ncbi:MAG: CHAT domain-containing protein [Acidimicrobiales bacterium]
MAAASVLGELQELAEGRHRDPGAVVDRATELLAAGARDPKVEATGRWVLGLAFHELGRPDDALASFRAALTVSLRHGFDDCAALSRASMAISLLNVGETAQADRQIASARRTAPDPVRGVVEHLYGLVLQRTGHHDEAFKIYRRALRELRQAGDMTSVARLLLNRSVLRGYRADLRGALADLEEAERISVSLDLPVLTAMAAHNTGWTHGRRGNLPAALAAFDRAKDAYGTLGDPPRLVAVLEADRCEVLLAAGLVTEARSAATSALGALELTGDLSQITDARLLLARALLAGGDYPAAGKVAQVAAQQFRAAKRLPWAALSQYVAIQADLLSLDEQRLPTSSMLQRTRRIAADLEVQGWPVESLHVRTFVGRIALSLGRPEVAQEELTRASAARRRGTASMRAQAWHVTALLRLAQGNEVGAKRAIGCGMDVVEKYRATLGATELRAQAAGHGTELARLGMSLALRDVSKPAAVLRWAERWRAGALHRPSVHPPNDERVAEDLAELRRLQTEAREATLEERTDRGLETRIAHLEDTVRNRTLQTRDDTATATGRIDVRALRSAIGDRVLVEYVALDGQLGAVTVTRRAVRYHQLGDTGGVEAEKRHLLFALRRLMWGQSASAGLDVAEHAVFSAAASLDRLLVAPLEIPSSAAVIVVPTGVLHGLPWNILPSLNGRPTTVAPSAALWCRPGGRGGGTNEPRVALVAGPGLPGADDEVRQLAQIRPGSTVLVGTQARVAPVLEAIERSDLVHLAAHGSFRADSPLFSSLLLADGPLTIYDLERLRSAPDTFVLPSCDAAMADVRAGDELLGTATALLALGVRSVVAPVMPVPDEATRDMMITLHRRLHSGEPPAEALAKTISGLGRLSERSVLVSAAAFLCIGCDEQD